MPDTRKEKLGEGKLDHNSDRYPTFQDVVSAVLLDIDDPEAVIERVELTALASGEATYRYWRPRAEDSEGGYLAAPNSV